VVISDQTFSLVHEPIKGERAPSNCSAESHSANCRAFVVRAADLGRQHAYD
jgi:hypothetical protein